MSAKSTKQTIEMLVTKTLAKHFQITAEAEVERYEASIKPGSLKHIDYAVPLFRHAKAAKQPPLGIYKVLEQVVNKGISCETEFVSGYMNIMLDDELLRQSLAAGLKAKTTTYKLNSAAVIINTSNDGLTTEASKRIAECLDYVGVKAKLLQPLPKTRNDIEQYDSKPRSKMLQALANIKGVVIESDTKAVYLQIGDEFCALRSAMGGWYAPAFTLAAIQQQLNQADSLFVIGLAETNQFVKTVFPNTNYLDVDTNASQLNDMSQEPIKQLVSACLSTFRSQTISSLSARNRRELIYALDFDYELAATLRLGDLSRAISKLVVLSRQHPISDVSRKQ
ncbi:MAG: hypothetical protein AAB971_03525 [Patescibacteria group bacterium]